MFAVAANGLLKAETMGLGAYAGRGVFIDELWLVRYDPVPPDCDDCDGDGEPCVFSLFEFGLRFWRAGEIEANEERLAARSLAKERSTRLQTANEAWAKGRYKGSGVGGETNANSAGLLHLSADHCGALIRLPAEWRRILAKSVELDCRYRWDGHFRRVDVYRF